MKKSLVFLVILFASFSCRETDSNSETIADVTIDNTVSGSPTMNGGITATEYPTDLAPEQEQFDWLQKELSGTAGNKHIVIFAHHPIFTISADEPDNSTSIPLARRTKYIDLFRKYRVGAIFAGHTHRNGNAQYGDMEMIITSAVGRPLGKDPSGFRVVKVYNEKLESFYYGLEEVPLEITFDK